MSKILEKPFSWANKIVRAVFRGAPNLITTSDLNRQIELLKKELYVQQQGVGLIVSDLAASISGKSVVTTGTYVYCAGVKFEISLAATYSLPTTGNYELRLYAKKALITYNDDFSKEISGAKFEDGDTLPAADHYVYKETKLLFSPLTTPDSSYQYPDSSGYEFICTLFRTKTVKIPTTGNFPETSDIQLFTVPMGRNMADIQTKYDTFRQVNLVTASSANRLVPTANDTWRDIVGKLWDRLYTVEKRFFGETLRNQTGATSSNYYVNDQSFATQRYYTKTFNTQAEAFGNCTITYWFFLVGNICFVNGNITIEKNTLESPLDKTLNFPISANNNEIPPCAFSDNTRIALTVSNSPGREHFGGYISGSKIGVFGVPAEGITSGFSCVYCFQSNKFWNYAIDDVKGDFTDMR